jgi:hypothetical protein
MSTTNKTAADWQAITARPNVLRILGIEDKAELVAELATIEAAWRQAHVDGSAIIAKAMAPKLKLQDVHAQIVNNLQLADGFEDVKHLDGRSLKGANGEAETPETAAK